MKVYTALFTEEGDEAPLLYYKGESVLRSGFPFFLPDREPCYEAVPVLALMIAKTGKEVATKFALRYVKALGVGFDLMAPRRLAQLSDCGYPWDAAVAFQDSAVAHFSEPYVQPGVVEEGNLLHYAAEQLTLSVTMPDGSHRSESFASYMPECAVAAFSQLNVIHQGDILLLRKSSTEPIPLSIESHIDIALGGGDEAPFRLRIK